MAKRPRRRATKKRPLPTVEPLTEAPPAPDRLGEYGIECWNRLAPLLVELRLLTALHLETFEALCDWWHVYQDNKVFLQANPDRETFCTDSGYEQRSPYAVARNEAFENFLKLSAKFGLTPEALKKLQGGRGGGGKPAAEDPAGAIGEFAAEKYSDD